MIKIVNSLGAELSLPIGIAWRDVPLQRVVPQTRLTDDGAVLSGKETLEPRQFTLSGSIWYPDKDQVQQEADDILAFLQHTPLEVYRHHTGTRYLKAYPTGIPQNWVAGSRELVLNVQMIALDPYWYGPQGTDETTVAASGATWSIAVDGKAPTYPVVTIVVNSLTCSDPVITQTVTGNKIRLDDDLVAGDVLVIDCSRMMITKNGVNAMSIAHDDWLVGGFALQPGDNPLEFTVTGTPDLTITTTWRPRWY